MFEKIIQSSDKDKLEYFNALLSSDNALKKRFEQYLQLKKSTNSNLQENNLHEYIEKIFTIFNNVDVSLYINSCSHSYYDYGYESDICEDIMESLFDEYEKIIQIAVSDDNFYKAALIMLAIYKAIELEPSVDDEFGLIYDYEDQLLENLSYIIAKQYEYMQALQTDERKNILTLFIKNIDNSDGHKFFKEFYNHLIINIEIANFLTNNISDFHIQTQLHILSFLDDDEQYLKSAKQFYKENSTVATMLLEKLNSMGRYNEYEMIAKECFEQSPHHFIDEIMKVIVPVKSKDFYIELLKYNAVSKKSLSSYKELKKFIHSDELKKIQEQIKNNHNSSYYISVLNYEKLYEEMLIFAKENLNVETSKYFNILKNLYPKELLEIIIQKCEEDMKSYNRSRKSYQIVCCNLSYAYKESTMQQEIKAYINALYNHKPKLPALQDELRRAKLIS